MSDELERFYDSIWGDVSDTAFEHKQLFDNDPNKLNPGKTRVTSAQTQNKDTAENVDKQCNSFHPPSNMVANYMANPNPSINPYTGMPYYLPPPGWCLMPSVSGYPYGYNPHYQPMQNTPAFAPQNLAPQAMSHQMQLSQQPQHYASHVPHSIGPVTIHRPNIQAANSGWINNAANGANAHFLPLQQKTNVVTEKPTDFWRDTAVCLSVGVLTLIALDVFTLSKH